MSARRRRTNSGSSETDAKRDNYYPPGNYNQQTSRTYSVQTENPSPPPPRKYFVDESNMTCRDRTNEFMSAVKSLQSRQVKRLNPLLYLLMPEFVKFVKCKIKINILLDIYALSLNNYPNIFKKFHFLL